MRQISPTTTCQDIVEWYFANHDPAAPWPKPMIEAAFLATKTITNRDRYVTFAVKGYQTLDAATRETIRQHIEIPSVVMSALEGEMSWPEPLAPTVMPPASLDAYRERMLNQLNVAAETQANRVIWGGDRLSQTYREKNAEARLFDNHPAPETLTEQDIPYIWHEALAKEKTTAEITAEILGQANPWREWDSRIVEPHRQLAQAAIRSATSVTEITAAYETARDAFQAGMDAIVAASIQ